MDPDRILKKIRELVVTRFDEHMNNGTALDELAEYVAMLDTSLSYARPLPKCWEGSENPDEWLVKD